MYIDYPKGKCVFSSPEPLTFIKLIPAQDFSIPILDVALLLTADHLLHGTSSLPIGEGSS